MTLVFLFELVDFMINLTQRTNLVEWQTNNTALLGNSLQNALTNPPYSIGNEFEASSLIELLCGLNQANVTLINQVSQRQSLMLILLCNRYHESKVCRHQLVLGALALRTTFANLLSQLDFLIDTDQRCTTNFHQIFIQCFTRTIRNTFLNL